MNDMHNINVGALGITPSPDPNPDCDCRGELRSPLADIPIGRTQSAPTNASPTQGKHGGLPLQVPQINDSFDATASAIFIANYGDNHRYIRDEERWLHWDGAHWNADIKGQQLSDALEDMRTKLKASHASYHLEKIAKNLANQRSLSQIKKHLESRKELSLLSFDCDAHEHLCAFENAVYNTDTNQLICDPARIRPLYLTRRFPVAYDSSATCEKWEAFLAQIFYSDEELIRYVQKAVGLSLSGKVLEEKLFFAYGSGANGKTTFFEVLNRIFGSFHQEIDSTVLIKSKVQDQRLALENMANLRGIRFATSNEIPERATYNDMIIKQLCSRDMIAAKVVFKSVTPFIPTHKLWIRSNHKPLFNVHDGGMMRRICLIPFAYKVPESARIERFEDTIIREKAGILKWIVDGWKLYQKEGMKVLPISMQTALNEYAHECDALKQFIDECCWSSGLGSSGLGSSGLLTGKADQPLAGPSLSPKGTSADLSCGDTGIPCATVKLKDFTAAYNTWCKENNFRSSNARTLASELRAEGYEIAVGTGNMRIIRCLGKLE